MPKNKSAIDKSLNYRTLSLRMENGQPATLDEKNRSVEMIGATENPVDVLDWKQWEIWPEVLRMAGCVLPESRQIPLLDTHMRYSSNSVIGSYRNMRLENQQLIGRAHFSEAQEAQGPYQKIREGHITDCSVGYRVLEITRVEKGKTETIAGKTYTGPMRVVTKWQPREMSICPIGADEMAKVRAATQQPITPQTEEFKMNEKIRKYLEGRGLPKNATEEEAYRFLETLEIRIDIQPPATPPVAPTIVPQPAAAANNRTDAEIALEERSRILEINGICDQAGLPDNVRQELITRGLSLDEAKTRALAHLTANSPQVGFVSARMEMGADERDKFRAAAQDGLYLRAGLAVEKPASGADDFRSFSLMELSRECLRRAKKPIGGDIRDMTGRALTSSDLPVLLGAIANKSLLEGFETSEETWQAWVGTGSVNNFQKQTGARPGEMDDLDEIGIDGEYKYGKTGERKEEYQVVTYGKIFRLSRQAIINDNLGALIDIPRMHGESVSRLYGDVVYAVLTANAAMGDGVDLFHATHSNIGTGGVPSETTIGEIVKLMKLQKDINGKRRLNIRPEFYLAPVTIEGSSEKIFRSEYLDVTSGSQQKNIYFGDYFKRVYEPRLDDDSATRYYFASRKGLTVKLFFLNGVATPYMELKQGWNRDGVEYKVRADAGAKAMDWRGLAKNDGF